MFSGDDVFKKIKMLSGGEKSRLKLCEIFKTEPNLLILDEPTNHMDIVGKESLENILKEYEGTLIFVSHDRYFVNKIANKILEFKPGKVTFFDGTYEEFQEYKEKNEIQEESIKENKNEIKTKEEKNNKNQYLINKEINKKKNKLLKIEKEIEEYEKEIKQIEQEIGKEENATDYIKLNELQEEIQKLNEKIEEKMIEWEEINATLKEKD